MNIFHAAYIAALVLEAIIRVPYNQRRKQIKVSVNRLTSGDTALLGLLFLVAVLQLLTAPVSAHMVGRTAYRTHQVDDDSLIADELADDLARAGFRRVDSDDVPDAVGDPDREA